MPAGRVVSVLCVLLAFARAAAADELELFHAAIEEFSSHNRVAIGYLRTENVELAAVEIERMRESWGAFAGRFSRPPPALRDNPLYVTTLVDVPTRLIGTLLVLRMSKPELARDSLIAIRKELSDLRRASHVEVLADCVLDANAAMDRLFGSRDQPPDLASPGAADELRANVEAYGAVIRRCDGMASAEIRQRGEFRRLIDGIAASLAQMPNAIAAGDGDLLRRLMIELRSLDDLLTFRYG